MHFEYDWDEAEYRRLINAVVWHGPQRRSTIILYGLAVLVLVYFGKFLIQAFFMRDTASALVTLPWVLMPLFWIILMIWWLPRFYARKHGRLFKGRQRIEFGEERVKGFSPVGTTELLWSAFSRAVETREFFLLFFGAGNAFYLPRRAAGPAEREAVRALLRQRFGERAKLRAD